MCANMCRDTHRNVRGYIYRYVYRYVYRHVHRIAYTDVYRMAIILAGASHGDEGTPFVWSVSRGAYRTAIHDHTAIREWWVMVEDSDLQGLRRCGPVHDPDASLAQKHALCLVVSLRPGQIIDD